MLGTVEIAGRLQVFAATSLLIGSVFCPTVEAVLYIPANDGYVTDTAKILTAEQEQSLEAALADYARETTNDVAVLIVQALDGTDVESFTNQVAREWKLGSTAHNNGILLFIAYDDHVIRFEVGDGLQGAVPDIVTSGIREQDMVPRFREGEYAAGITAAIDSLKKHIGGEYTADRYARQEGGAGFGAYGFFAALVALQWLLSILGRTKSWWLGGILGGTGGLLLALMFGWWLTVPLLIVVGLFLDYAVSKNYSTRGPTSWWAGGGWGPGGGGFSGGRGGGGFGGFGGGGGFSGGGSTGRW